VTEVQRAIADGVVTLNTLGLRPVPTLSDAILVASGKQDRRSANRVDISERLLREITESVAPSATTHPLFDEQTGGLLRALIDEGILPGVDLQRSSHAHLAGYLVGSLDAFPDAPVDEVLDVRTALAEPLIRFRSAVTSMARDLESRPIDPGFRQEADALYRERVAPELLALDESFREGRIRGQLWQQLSSWAVATGIKRAVAMGFTTYVLLPDLAGPNLACA